MMFRSFLLSLSATALCGVAVAEAPPPPTLTRAEIEGRYATAKVALEDETITEVEHVPALLALCSQAGYAPAARLLIDVYEGKFKGLDANPAKAAAEAKVIAEVPIPFPDDPDCAAMHIEAMYRYALYLERGYGCEKDEKAAYDWMTKAANAGLPEAQAERARMLARGKGTEKNMKLAWEILRGVAKTAPETQHVFFYMGYICYSSQTAAGRRRAAELFYLGAQHRDADCLNNLAAMYEKGIAVKQDTAKALSLYGKAAVLGNKQASANRQRLAYKAGIDAHRQESTPPVTRIANAVQRVIRMLPINDKSQDRLWLWLSGHPTS